MYNKLVPRQFQVGFEPFKILLPFTLRPTSLLFTSNVDKTSLCAHQLHWHQLENMIIGPGIDAFNPCSRLLCRKVDMMTNEETMPTCKEIPCTNLGLFRSATEHSNTSSVQEHGGIPRVSDEKEHELISIRNITDAQEGEREIERKMEAAEALLQLGREFRIFPSAPPPPPTSIPLLSHSERGAVEGVLASSISDQTKKDGDIHTDLGIPIGLEEASKALLQLTVNSKLQPQHVEDRAELSREQLRSIGVVQLTMVGQSSAQYNPNDDDAHPQGKQTTWIQNCQDINMKEDCAVRYSCSSAPRKRRRRQIIDTDIHHCVVCHKDEARGVSQPQSPPSSKRQIIHRDCRDTRKVECTDDRLTIFTAPDQYDNNYCSPLVKWVHTYSSLSKKRVKSSTPRRRRRGELKQFE